MYCNLTKSQAFPLAVRVSFQSPRCFKSFDTSKSQYFAFGSHSKLPKNQFTTSFRSCSDSSDYETLEKFYSMRPHTLSITFQFMDLGRLKNITEPRYFSGMFRLKSVLRNDPATRGRSFSSLYAQKAVEDSGSTVEKGKTLPWLASKEARETKRSAKTANVKVGRSSWEESAEKFLKPGTSTVENSRTSAMQMSNSQRDKFVAEAEEETEAINDPRWDKIKNRFSRTIDVKSRSDRPEFRKFNKQESWGRKTWKEATESTVPTMVGEGIYGVGPVLAALSAGRREFYALYVQEGLDLSGNNRKKKDKKGIEKVLRIAQKMGISRKEVLKHDLNMAVENRPHQGLVLDASPLEMVGIKELDPVTADGERGLLWVALDEVTDPQNLGAIIRSAYYFGASGVVLCAKNSAPLSGVVSKASAGSLELMELRSCKNMMQFLVSSADNGWRVLGGSVSSRALPLDEVEPGEPTILVLGSEGTGLRPLVERSCTDLVRIPGSFPVDISAGLEDGETTGPDRGCSGEEFQSFLAVESLNVSVAAGVLLHHLIGSNYKSYQLGDR